MNFNLNPSKVFDLLKGNLKGILNYAMSFTSCFLIFIGSLFLCYLLYKYQIGHYIPTIVLGVIASIFALVMGFYFSGFNAEIMHNFIEEKEDFMPLAKRRFKEFLKKGAAVTFFSLIYILVGFAVLFIFVYSYNFIPKNLLDILVSFSFVLMGLVFISFLMAYIHTFKMKSFFSKDNFKIFAYAYPEFIYSYVLTQIFLIVLGLAGIVVLLVPLIIVGCIVYGIFLANSQALGMTLCSIIAIAFIILSIFFVFVLGLLESLFGISLNAQSFNYGKYFFHMGEAPKRKPIEYILPILLLILFCFANIQMNKMQEKSNSGYTPSPFEFIQKY